MVKPHQIAFDETEMQLRAEEVCEFAAGVARGRADIAAGRVIGIQEVSDWVNSWGTAAELPQPKPVGRA